MLLMLMFFFLLSSLTRGFGKIIPGSLMIAKAVADQSNKTHNNGD